MNILFFCGTTPTSQDKAWVSGSVYADNGKSGVTDKLLTCVKEQHSAQLLPINLANLALYGTVVEVSEKSHFNLMT